MTTLPRPIPPLRAFIALLLASLAGPQLVAQAAAPALTIYNQDFAVVRERVPLDVKAGANTVTFNGVTAQVEADSVVLRDAAGKNAFRILEQGYRADTISPGLMLELNLGNTITFLVRDKDQKEFPVLGKIIRSGYTAGQPGPYYDGSSRPRPGGETPIIEVDGKLRFSLPGEPIFPRLADDSILQPTLVWKLDAATPAKFEAELSYVTGGFTWQAAYNLVAPEKGGTMDITGWVTMQNNSGARFDNATVKLMAGNVNKVQPQMRQEQMMFKSAAMAADMFQAATEKAFDEFHLYSLVHPVTLRDRETKQVEFIRATGVKSETFYVYDGVAKDQYRGWDPQSIRGNPDYGTQSSKKVWVMREFKNTKENGLGLPLPAGRVRFYRQDDADKRIEFTGENQLEHTPQGETVRLYTGDAFDLVGERKRTNFQADNRNQVFDETFEIKLRNRKAEPVEIRVVEHFLRWNNWTITEKTDEFTKTDAQTAEFRVKLAPDQEKTVTYRVRYDSQATPAARGGGRRGGLAAPADAIIEIAPQ